MSFSDLYQRIDQIRSLLIAAQAAKRLPDERARAAKAVRLEYGSNEAVRETFAKVRDAYAEDERRQGEIARDRELKRLASELDRLRADLPDLAAAARFELLDHVGEWRA